MTDEEYLFLKRKILQLTSINLDHYKSNQMRRRLDCLISNMNCTDVLSYCTMLEHDIKATHTLQDFLTINVSEFFRDMKYFDRLLMEVIPQMVKNCSRLNIWSAGCSNGSEPYSIAMSLDHMFPSIDYRILATDIDEKSLMKAREGGPYRIDEIRNVSQPLLKKYFIETGEGYRVIENVRRSILFRHHDLLQDTAEQGFDFILCRNVVIYFTQQAKYELYKKFHRSLKENGILFIGGTETILDATEIGFQLDSTCFYRKVSRVASEVQATTSVSSSSR
jgi:chemotaxis protein methyltransferase CheR